MKPYTDEGVLQYMTMTAMCLLLPHVFGLSPAFLSL
ncbi:rCG57328, isoform CRA_a [Rattus norvegicus]|uniref:RCG57328, isoform CRA_a n=1 Tax=Rattus norvegicus TaxID=10116 RepID=A6JPG1_RAT|nr:rCG57328, isoform CRA_a [Rattus norvegicus]